MSAARTRLPARALGPITLLCVAALGVRLSGQAFTVQTAGDAVRVVAPGWRFIDGPVLERLRSGRSVRVDLELTALAAPEGPALAESRQQFNVSYDLWEERFAVTRVSAPRRSMSHLTAREAEAWCLEHVRLPAAALRRPGRNAPFWVTLAYRIQNPDPEPDVQENRGSFTVRRLIDILSRRERDDEHARSMQAGPFRIPD